MTTTNDLQSTTGESHAGETVMQRANRLANRLYGVLEAELLVLQTRRVEEIGAMTEEKRTLIDQLAELEPAVKSLLTSDNTDGKTLADEEEVLAFKNRIQACQARNKNNQALALMELDHSREALALLRSLMQLEDVTLYGAGGNLSVIREKRNLGAV